MFNRNAIAKKYDRITVQIDDNNNVTITGHRLLRESVIIKGRFNSEITIEDMAQIISGKNVILKIRHNSRKKAAKWKRPVIKDVKKSCHPNEAMINAVKLMVPTVQKTILRNLDDDAGHSYCASTVLVKN